MLPKSKGQRAAWEERLSLSCCPVEGREGEPILAGRAGLMLRTRAGCPAGLRSPLALPQQALLYCNTILFIVIQ